VRYHDPRRFGFVDLVAAENLSSHPMLAKLGPEPLEGNFTGVYLAARLAGRGTSVKSAILDQRVVAGMGNIYACESLFRAGMSPRRSAATVIGKRAERLVSAIRDVLAEAIAAGGSSLRDHRRPSGELGYFQHRFAVYGRAGQPCPGCTCDLTKSGGVRRIVQVGRSTFYCAKYQR
jgi:formamidopyrimidine-DNA glycosylase